MFRRRFQILLSPGLGLKRWLAMLMLGFLLLVLGTAFAIAEPLSPKILPVFRTLTLNSFPPLVRGVVFVSLGGIAAGLALFEIYKLLISGAVFGRGRMDVLVALHEKRRQGQGVRVVAIGGGTGLSTLLRGLKKETRNLTAIVTIADDGGSSGQLRTDLHIPPPGDARNCLVALSESEPLLEELFNYRFKGGSSLEGHSLGNLLLAALFDMRGGFHQSLKAAAELLALSGQVVPVAENGNLVLMGETESGLVLKGESEVGHTPEPLKKVWIEPEGVVASEAALRAISQAELIVIGPGSLYTSIIPNFLVKGLSEAIEASSAQIVFVCNVASEPHETFGLDVGQHLQRFLEYSGINVDQVLVNSHVVPLPKESGQEALTPASQIDGYQGLVILKDLVDVSRPVNHDPEKLANALLAVGRRFGK